MRNLLNFRKKCVIIYAVKIPWQKTKKERDIMENVQKKTPKILGIALIVYFVCAAVISVASNGFYMVTELLDSLMNSYDFSDFIREAFEELIEYGALADFIKYTIQDFFNSIWIMLLAVFIMFIYRKNDKSILLPIALAVGTVTSFIAACTWGWDFVEYVIHIPEYGIEINFFEVVDILTWIVEVVAEFFVPLALLAAAVGAFSRKLLLLSKIGSIAYLLVCVVNLVSNAIYSLTFVVSQDYMSIIERISNRVIYFSVYIVEFLPAIVLALLFFKYIKKPQEEAEAAPVEITEEI